MHAKNQHVIFGASYAIHNEKSYPWYERALANKCLVDSASFMHRGE